MKILHICLYGPVTDGWNYQDNLLPKYQAKAGYEVTVIAGKWVYDRDGKLRLYNKSDYDFRGVRMIRLDLLWGKDINSKLKKYKGLYEKIKQVMPDMIFVHNVCFTDVAQIVRYAKEHKVAIVADSHNDYRNSAKNWVSKVILHKGLWRHYAHLIEPYATKFYGVLPARVDFLKEVYKLPADKCEMLVMGVDDELVEAAKHRNCRALVRKKYNIRDSEILILTGGKIDGNKRETLELMRAVAEISDVHRIGVKLLVFGSVSDQIRDEFMQASENASIIYAGWLDSDKIYEYFEAADLVAFPGLHSVLWEQAVGSGKACIFRKMTGFQHIDLGGNCCYFENLSVEGMKRSLYEALETGRLREMTQIAEEKGMDYFSYKQIARRCIWE